MTKQNLIGLVFCACIFSSATHADTVSFSSGIFSNSETIDIGLSGDFSFGAPTTVTGLPKFDPSLGTLTGVIFDISPGSLAWSADIDGAPEFNADFTGEFAGDFQADLVYFDGISGLVQTTLGDSVSLFCEGTQGEASCFDSNSNSLDYDNDAFDFPSSFGAFNSSDIVGTGDVTNLLIDISFLNASFVQSDNFADLTVSGQIDVTNATVTVTYEFTPSAVTPTQVPLPALMTWVLGIFMVLLGIGVFRKTSI